MLPDSNSFGIQKMCYHTIIAYNFANYNPLFFRETCSELSWFTQTLCRWSPPMIFLFLFFYQPYGLITDSRNETSSTPPPHKPPGTGTINIAPNATYFWKENRFVKNHQYSCTSIIHRGKHIKSSSTSSQQCMHFLWTKNQTLITC